jgi:transposase
MNVLWNWEREYIDPYKKGKALSLMIWGAIWGNNRSELILMERDPASKKNGYSANFYLEVLKENIPYIWEPGMTFVQDNAPIHRAKKVDDWVEEIGLGLCKWPPYSPDLNPIENLWTKLKEQLYKLDPDLEDLMRSQEEKEDRFFKALEAAWESLPESYIHSLIYSMKQRVRAVIEADGWYTCY